MGEQILKFECRLRQLLADESTLSKALTLSSVRMRRPSVVYFRNGLIIRATRHWKRILLKKVRAEIRIEQEKFAQARRQYQDLHALRLTMEEKDYAIVIGSYLFD